MKDGASSGLQSEILLKAINLQANGDDHLLFGFQASFQDLPGGVCLLQRLQTVGIESWQPIRLRSFRKLLGRTERRQR